MTTHRDSRRYGRGASAGQPGDSGAWQRRWAGARLLVWIGLGMLVVGQRVPAAADPEAQLAFLEARGIRPVGLAPAAAPGEDPAEPWQRFQELDPTGWDWFLQDALESSAPEQAALPSRTSLPRMVGRVLAELVEARTLAEEAQALREAGVRESEVRWAELYARACAERRRSRLRGLAEAAARIVFVKRHTIRPSFFAYTEGQSDAQHERHFLPGSALCLLGFQGGETKVSVLLEDSAGVIRDPAVSWDGARVAFAWKRSLGQDDYHLFELDVASGEVRQLTSGLGLADYEPAYLPNGDLVFSSTRCVQTVDCWWTEVSNLYTCGPDGEHVRRLTFDQVHSVSPSVLEDGRVIYTRWDYNDRGQIFPQALFQMNGDGTGQSEVYGNNSWFPTTIVHARGIPGTERMLAVFCGHHTAQAGKLGILDPSLGRQENQGAQLTAPGRATPAVRVDAYGQEGALFSNPFPLSREDFLVAAAPLGWGYRGGHFAVYWMDHVGRRELLAFDPGVSCHQPVILRARAAPAQRASRVDYGRTDGTCYVQDIYHGPGLRGIERGSIDRLRVVALEFRAAGVGNNFSSGPAGGALVSTPIAVGNGTWDVKVVLGETPVYSDGSAFFRVPARTPFYFQALDERGRALQTMRSWMTLQPGENASCTGCHEDKNTTPPAVAPARSLALSAGPHTLTPFHGPARGFSFSREIQPILDRHCIACHYDRSVAVPSPDRRGRGGCSLTRGEEVGTAQVTEASFSLLGAPVLDSTAKRYWSEAYLALTGARLDSRNPAQPTYVAPPDRGWVRWIGSQSGPEPLPPMNSGAVCSPLLALLDAGHRGVDLSREERDKLACWIDLLVPFCGDYREAAAWSDPEREFYARFLEKRRAMEVLDQQSLQVLSTSP